MHFNLFYNHKPTGIWRLRHLFWKQKRTRNKEIVQCEQNLVFYTIQISFNYAWNWCVFIQNKKKVKAIRFEYLLTQCLIIIWLLRDSFKYKNTAIVISRNSFCKNHGASLLTFYIGLPYLFMCIIYIFYLKSCKNKAFLSMRSHCLCTSSFPCVDYATV